MDKHLLSICIPTNGVARWVVPSIRQIYSLGTDESLFEVVVADNGGENSDLENHVKEFEVHSNFRYVKTQAAGFYNIIENFLLARGDYMIKINHRSLMQKGSIEYICKQAETYYDKKPLMYFSNGIFGGKGIRNYNNFNDFLYDLSYFSSLSEGLFFWKEDLLRVPVIKFAKMSPNVSLMFDSRNKSHFVLDDTRIFNDQNPKGKYGYDLFDTFAVLYLDLVNEVRMDGSITKQTYLKVKNELYCFLMDCYVMMKLDGGLENYSLDGMKDSLSVYFSKWDYYYMVYKTKYYIRHQRKWYKIKSIPQRIARKIKGIVSKD